MEAVTHAHCELPLVHQRLPERRPEFLRVAVFGHDFRFGFLRTLRAEAATLRGALVDAPFSCLDASDATRFPVIWFTSNPRVVELDVSPTSMIRC